jgi:hypothetical protein
MRFYAIAIQVAAQAARSGHGKFAQELRELVDQVKARAKAIEPVRGQRPVPLAQPRGELAGFLTVGYPKTRFADMALTGGLRISGEQRNEQGARKSPDPPWGSRARATTFGADVRARSATRTRPRR